MGWKQNNKRMNSVTLIGRIGNDLESKTFDNGNTKYSFNLATTDNYKDKDGKWQEATEWHKVFSFRDIGYLSKGDMIVLEGKIKTRSYESGGERKYITEIEARNVKRLIKNEKTVEPVRQEEGNELPF